MKVFILADIPGWIVDRIADRMIEGMPSINFVKAYYTKITPGGLVTTANGCDLVHYLNWDLRYHLRVLDQIRVPLLISIRSHRWPQYIHETQWGTNVHWHVLTKELQRDFPQAHLIPDGIFEMFDPGGFTVGYAGLENSYKGTDLIRQACRLEDVGCLVASGGWPPRTMPDFYRSLDLYVCASVNEGHSTTVCEAAAMNVPIASTPVGFGAQFAQYIIEERSVEGIRKAIQHFNTHARAKAFYWKRICPKFEALYKELVCSA